MANRCNTPGTRNVCHESEELTMNRPKMKSLADRSRILINIARLVHPFLTIDFIEKVKLNLFVKPDIDYNLGTEQYMIYPMAHIIWLGLAHEILIIWIAQLAIVY